MNSGHGPLWQQIESFAIDGPEIVAFPFCKRLAQENDWSDAFAARAIVEYKRFVYLAMTAGHMVCPSEAVDEVWHLHLTYTRSYWDRFCKDVLGKPLHHDPTKGGPVEAAKHLQMYASTLASYRRVFGAEPPSDIWPPAAIRFANRTPSRWSSVHPLRAVTRWIHRRSLGAAAALTVTALMTGCVGPIVADASERQEYLLLYIVALVSAYIVAMLVRQFLRQPDGDVDLEKEPLDRYDTAFLAGGPIRLFDTALIHLLETGALAHAGEGKVKILGALAKNADPIDEAIYDYVSTAPTDSVTIADIRKNAKIDLEPRRRGLEEKRLFLSTGRSFFAAFAPVVIMLAVLIGLGGQRIAVGIEAKKPTGYIIAIFVIGFIITIASFSRRPRRTLRGDGYLKSLLKHYTELGPTVLTARTNLVIATAILGTGVLAATEYESFAKALHPRSDPTSSGSGCGSGCAASGCGGDGGAGGGCGGGCGGGGCGGGGD